MVYRTSAVAAVVAFSLLGVTAAEEQSEFAGAAIDVGMVVSDVAKSMKFYTEALGLRELPGLTAPGAFAADIGLTDGSEDLVVHVLALSAAPGATKLKLMQFKRQPANHDTAAINSQLGIRYLTIFVNDTGTALERLKKYGAKPVGKTPQPLPEGFPAGIYLTTVRDPDGNPVEIIGPKK